MPHDALSKAWKALNTPMVPKGAIQPVQDALDDPTGEYGPLEATMRGFGAGALDGLRDLTSPVNIAAMLPVGRGIKTARGATQGLKKAWSGPLDDVLTETRTYNPQVPAYKRPPKAVPDNPVAQALDAEREADLAQWAMKQRPSSY